MPDNAGLGAPESCDAREAGQDSGTDTSSADHNRRLGRYGHARSRALAMLNFLRERREAEAAEAKAKLRDCGDFLEFRHYFTLGQVRLTRACFCKQHLICPLCAIRRGSKYLEKYLERYRVLLEGEGRGLKPVLITFTVKNGRNLGERFEHLADSLKVLRDRRRKGRECSEFRKVKGLVGSFEVTKNGQEWHPHVHVFALIDQWIDRDALVEEWREITGDSFMIDVRAVRGEPAKAFAEVFKYALKFSSLTPADTWHCARYLKGRNLLFSAGLFRGVVVPDQLTDQPIEGLPYVELFYRYLPGVGYSLASAPKVERAQ